METKFISEARAEELETIMDQAIAEGRPSMKFKSLGIKERKHIMQLSEELGFPTRKISDVHPLWFEVIFLPNKFPELQEAKDVKEVEEGVLEREPVVKKKVVRRKKAARRAK